MFTEVDKTTPKKRNFLLVSSLGSGSITGLSYVLKRKAYITFLPKLLCTKLKPNYSVLLCYISILYKVLYKQILLLYRIYVQYR